METPSRLFKWHTKRHFMRWLREGACRAVNLETGWFEEAKL